LHLYKEARSAEDEAILRGGRIHSVWQKEKGSISISLDGYQLNRIFAVVTGAIFLVIGVLGFFVSSTITEGRLLNLFDVDLMHNLIYLLTGITGIITAIRTRSLTRFYIRIFGFIYLILGIAGLIYPTLYFSGRLLGIMHVSVADHVLHLVAGVVAVILGFFVEE
jgi:cytochrome bd-type quinol oxidase subunit 2